MVQLQDLISDLRVSNDTDVKNEIKTAKHYIQDADKLKQVTRKLMLKYTLYECISLFHRKKYQIPIWGFS